MPIGGPDDGRLDSSQSGTLANPAIDTARGAGFSLIDNLGRLILYDNFDQGLAGWGVSGSGSSYPAIKVRRDNLVYGVSGLNPFGRYALLLPGAAAAVPQVSKVIVVPKSGNMGVEIALRSDYAGAVGSGSNVELFLTLGFASSFAFGFRYNSAAGQFEIRNNAPAWVAVATFDRGLAGKQWWRYKAIVNPTTGSYERIILPKQTLTGLGITGPATSLTDGQIDISIYVNAGAPTPSNEYVGYFALTQDEPA